MFKKYSFLIIVLMLGGCATTESQKKQYDGPGWQGYISTSVSEFDGTKTLNLEPAFLNDGASSLRLGLRWNNRMDKDQFLLVAEWTGALNFSPDSDLRINIDSDIVGLKPLSSSQYGVTQQKTVMSNGPISIPVNIGNHTTKNYLISKKLLSRIILAKKSVVRVEFLDTYTEVQIEPNKEAQSSYVLYPNIWSKYAFKLFLERLQVLI